MAIASLIKLYHKVRTSRQTSLKGRPDQNIPVRIQDLDDLEEKVNEVITQVNTNTTAVVPAYTTYVSKMTQAGTAAPTVSIQENTIGTIVWAYSYPGGYTGTLAGAFPDEAKVHAIIGKSTGNTMDEPFIYWNDANSIVVEVANQSGTLANDLLQDNPIEIRVYS